MQDDRPFVIERPNTPGRLDGKVRLGPEAHEWRKVHGLTEIEFAKYLLQQHARREAGLLQREGEG